MTEKKKDRSKYKGRVCEFAIRNNIFKYIDDLGELLYLTHLSNTNYLFISYKALF